MYKIKAFTLAEVLITLLIIGVVASLVIPAIIQDAQDAELKTAWKKAYSDFSQAAMRITVDNGGTLKDLFTSDNEVNNQLKNYMGITRYCPYGTVLENCWHSSVTKSLNGTTTWANGTGFILNNGSMVFLNSRRLACDGTPDNFCLHLSIDINGLKSPNCVGKDILGLFIFENSVKPLGYQGDTSYQNSCKSTALGFGCSAVYLYQ
jgi:prepilin-type N-terminal cleavage/methylation domain-containing protein